MSQLVTSMNKLESKDKLLSQTKVNSKPNMSAVTLRSGKELLKTLLQVHLGQGLQKDAEPEALGKASEVAIDANTRQTKPNSGLPVLFTVSPPFLERFTKTKKEEDKEILENFYKVKVNIPLLDAIKQVSRSTKFLKELCTNKKKLSYNEKISVGENV